VFFAGATAERFVAFDMVLESGGRSTRQLAAKSVALTYFDLVGITPARGRFFTAGDSDAVENHIVVSDGVWRSLRKNSRDVFAPLSVRTAEREFTIIGVLPRGAEDATVADVLVASARVGAPTLVRAKPGFDRARILAELAALNSAMAGSLGTPNAESAFKLRPMIRAAKPVQRLYLALIASAVAILLIAGANLANVQLARGMARRGELAVRMALGASRRDLVKLITWESAQLALIGAVAGLALAVWGMEVVHVLLPDGVPGLGPVRPQLSWRVLGFATVAAVLCTATVGLLPALTLSRFDLTTTIKSGGGSLGLVRARSRRYPVLVIAQIAACLALTIGAGLVWDAGLTLHRLEFGYDVRPLVGVNLRAGFGALLEPSQLVANLRLAPRVQSAAVVHIAHYDSGAVTVETAFGNQSVFEMPAGSFTLRWVTPDLFRTVGVQPMSGTDFPQDDAVPAVMVDSIAAAQIWRGANPVGRMIRLGGLRSDRPFVRVVGVVPHLRWDVGQYGDAVPELQVYYVGRTLGSLPSVMWWGMAVVRVGNSAADVAGVRSHLSGQPAYRVTEAWADFVGLNRLTASHDLLATVFGVFAALALLLATTGVYSVVAYTVACRRREMGVRVALGASRERIFQMVVGEENLTTLLGLGIGLLAAEWGSGIIADTIFTTAPERQMAIIVVAAVGMFGVALVAAGIPGIRAARVSPAEALRSD
jgi:predicted permease